MNSLDAMRRMVAAYPGGRPAVATRMGKTDEVLRKELSGVQTHKLGLADAEEIALMCHEAGVVEAISLATVLSFGVGQFLKLPEPDQSLPSNLLASTARAVHECSDVLLAVTNAKADGNISDNDKKAVLHEIQETVAALQQAAQALKTAHAADNLRHTLRAA